MPSTPLADADHEKMVAACNRIGKLEREKSAIVSKESQAQAEEIKALRQYLGNMLLKHAVEFLNCRARVKQQFEPLINVLASCITPHTLTALAHMAAAQQQSQSQQAPEGEIIAENVIQLLNPPAPAPQP